MRNVFIADIIFLVILTAFAMPLGSYIYKVMTGQKVLLTKAFLPIENGIYKALGVKDETETTAQKYITNMLVFSGIGFLFLFTLQIVQGFLPFNPQHLGSTSLSLACPIYIWL